MLRKAMIVILMGSTLALAACNTVRGAGRDLESAANAVDRAT
jgi:predicted small secreted protein